MSNEIKPNPTDRESRVVRAERNLLAVVLAKAFLAKSYEVGWLYDGKRPVLTMVHPLSGPFGFHFTEAEKNEYFPDLPILQRKFDGASDYIRAGRLRGIQL